MFLQAPPPLQVDEESALAAGNHRSVRARGASPTSAVASAKLVLSLLALLVLKYKYSPPAAAPPPQAQAAALRVLARLLLTYADVC
jgi:hypothetical protein